MKRVVSALLLLVFVNIASAQVPATTSRVSFSAELMKRPVLEQLIVSIDPTVTDQEAKAFFMSLGYLVLESHPLPEGRVKPKKAATSLIHAAPLEENLLPHRVHLPARASEHEAPWYRIYVGSDLIAAKKQLSVSKEVRTINYVYRERWELVKRVR